MVVEMARRAERRVVPTSAQFEHGERGVGVIDAEALAALVRVLHHPTGTGPRGFLVALPRLSQHVRGSGRAEQSARAGERHDVFDLHEVRGGRSETTLKDFEPASQAQRERQWGERADSTRELLPLMCEIAPGPLVEDVRCGQNGVEIRDMDAATGDGLELFVILRGVGHGRAQHRRRLSAFSGQTSGDPSHQLRDRVRNVAPFDDGDGPGRDRLSGGLFDEVPAEERYRASGDTGSDRDGGLVGVDERQRLGQQRSWLGARCRRRCGSTPPSTPPRPGVVLASRSPVARSRISRARRPRPPTSSARAASRSRSAARCRSGVSSAARQR